MKTVKSSDGFLGLPSEIKSKNKVLVIPFGLENTVSYVGGTKMDPRKIIKASHQVELFDDELKNGSHIEILEALLGFKPNGVAAAWFDRPIGDDIGIEPHKDAYGSDKSEKVGATIWLSLDKASRDNGCLSYLRGSHKKVYPDIIPIPGINKDSENAFFAELNPGDAVVHSSSIVHWSEGNQSLMPRRAVSYFYFGAKI